MTTVPCGAAFTDHDGLPRTCNVIAGHIGGHQRLRITDVVARLADKVQELEHELSTLKHELGTLKAAHDTNDRRRDRAAAPEPGWDLVRDQINDAMMSLERRIAGRLTNIERCTGLLVDRTPAFGALTAEHVSKNTDAVLSKLDTMEDQLDDLVRRAQDTRADCGATRENGSYPEFPCVHPRGHADPHQDVDGDQF